MRLRVWLVLVARLSRPKVVGGGSRPLAFRQKTDNMLLAARPTVFIWAKKEKGHRVLSL